MFRIAPGTAKLLKITVLVTHWYAKDGRKVPESQGKPPPGTILTFLFDKIASELWFPWAQRRTNPSCWNQSLDRSHPVYLSGIVSDATTPLAELVHLAGISAWHPATLKKLG